MTGSLQVRILILRHSQNQYTVISIKSLSSCNYAYIKEILYVNALQMMK